MQKSQKQHYNKSEDYHVLLWRDLQDTFLVKKDF